MMIIYALIALIKIILFMRKINVSRNAVLVMPLFLPLMLVKIVMECIINMNTKESVYPHVLDIQIIIQI